MNDQAEVSARLAALRLAIDDVARSWTHAVEIVAVTKGFPGIAIESALRAGCGIVGENYAQEIQAKREVIEQCRPEVQFIGHLQTNKVRLVADLVDLWASVDRPSLVKEIARRDPGGRVLIQVNTTGEQSKSGCAPGEVSSLVEGARLGGLKVEGLMTVGPTGQPSEAARAGFKTLRSLVDAHDLATCSMGMTADALIAVEEGSTAIRIGTGLFGSRPPRT